MGKTYIDTVKYVVYSDVEIDGLVEKPDVVGAIFGQTEGLLGDDLDLRDLQKNGRIGRIEVDLNVREGKTTGGIRIPSSLDMVETCIIAAALETVDRVGPCEARVKVQKVEDTRNVKRKVMIDRAKLLLKALLTHEIPESKEISEMVRDEVKTAEITEYGPDRLPAGPMLDKTNEIVIVEGRADVINLLKNDVNNVVAIGGAKVPPSIVRLSKEREVTVFLDGDRGGDIILNELVQGGVEIDYIARAPTGKEVEELTRKELIKCLRGKVPFEQTGDQRDEKKKRYENRTTERRENVVDAVRGSYQPQQQYQPAQHSQPSQQRYQQSNQQPYQPSHQNSKPETQNSLTYQPPQAFSPVPVPRETPKEIPIEPIQPVQPVRSQGLSDHSPSSLMDELNELNNTLRARFYNSNFEKIREIAVRDVIKALEETNDVLAIVFDGIITQRLVDLASSRGVKKLVGVKRGNVNKIPDGIEVLTKMK